MSLPITYYYRLGLLIAFLEREFGRCSAAYLSRLFPREMQGNTRFTAVRLHVEMQEIVLSTRPLPLPSRPCLTTSDWT